MSEWTVKPGGHRGSGKQHLTEEEGRRRLETYGARCSTRQEWEARAGAIREGIQKGAELYPWPAKTPLNPAVHSRRDHAGYTVENVVFESLPGHFVTGNLYRPQDAGTPLPGILSPHGHARVGRFEDHGQIRAATLARMGAIVFAWDMVGYGESRQLNADEEGRLTFPKLMGLHLWNSLRSLDFLLSLDGIDPDRIGMTGESGGGSQTFFAAAVDDRIRFPVPVVQVSAHFYGGCLCESGMPIHEGDGYQTVNAEIAAAAAPRPQMIVSDGADWTKNVPDVEFPYIRNVYNLYGAADDVELFHDAEGKHDYNAVKRAPVYDFFIRRMGLRAIPDESGSILEPHEALRAITENHPLPGHALRGDDQMARAWAELTGN